MPCFSPYYVDAKAQGKVPVNCGRCPYCKRRRVTSWAFRLRKESDRNASAFFITLTYAKSPPMSRNGFMTLNKTDWQKFMKLLRYHSSGTIWKYYTVGEYGDTNKRPHYHAILFSSIFYTDVNLSHLLLKSWPHGLFHIGKVSGASIAYTLKYIDKDSKIPLHKRDDRMKEFSLMSKGLGSNYLTNQIKKYHCMNLDRNYAIMDGFKLALPRYYREKILSDHEKYQQRVIISKEVALQQEIDRREFDKHHPNGDYEDYLSENKRYAYEAFYSQQKPRKL